MLVFPVPESMSYDVEMTDMGEKGRLHCGRADANAVPVADLRAHPSAHLPAIGAETVAIDDGSVSFGIVADDRSGEIGKRTRLARQLSGREREIPRLLDRIGSSEYHRGL